MKIVDEKDLTCRDSNGKEVEFGETYKSDCNTCLCGKHVVCTLKACNVFEDYEDSHTDGPWKPAICQIDPGRPDC